MKTKEPQLVSLLEELKQRNEEIENKKLPTAEQLVGSSSSTLSLMPVPLKTHRNHSRIKKNEKKEDIY